MKCAVSCAPSAGCAVDKWTTSDEGDMENSASEGEEEAGELRR